MRNPRNDPLTPDIDGGGEGASSDESSGPERRCILTGCLAPREALVRLALSPPGEDGVCEVLPDARARAPGRGAWIGVDKAPFAHAVNSGKLGGALARAFKGRRPIVREDLPDLIETALRQSVLQRLGLEMRAGHLILGSDRIERAARVGSVVALYHAADASEDGMRRLDQAWRVGQDAQGSGMAGLSLPLDRTALSVALGRENVVHLALGDQASDQRFALALQRLNTFVGVAPGMDRALGRDDRAADDAARAVQGPEAGRDPPQRRSLGNDESL